MSEMDNVEYLRGKLKRWEKKFENKHGRMPLKADIQRYPEVGMLTLIFTPKKVKVYQDYNRVKKAAIGLKENSNGININQKGWNFELL